MPDVYIDTKGSPARLDQGDIEKALGRGRAVEFRGRTWTLEPLNFLDLADAQALGLFKGDQATDLSPLSILWLMLRKADPDLTETQRDHCQYSLTPRDVAALFSLNATGAEDAGKFMGTVIAFCGLTEAANEQADAPTEGSNAEGAQPKKARGARPAKTPPATPIAE